MEIALKVIALILLVVAFVAAYYTGKAELTVDQMFRQPEIRWGFWGSYGCWLIADLLGPEYTIVYVIVKLLIYMGIWILLVIVQAVGLRRKQTQRDNE